jgi:hypothetical protein
MYYEFKVIKQKAQDLFSSASDAKCKDRMDSIKRTQELINDAEVEIILNPQFICGNLFASFDIIKRCKDKAAGWDIIEVKVGKKNKLKYIEGVSFKILTLINLGMQINSVSIMHINSKFRLGMDDKECFELSDVTDKVDWQTTQFVLMAQDIEKQLYAEEVPEAAIKRKCKNCPLFLECVGAKIKNPIFELPRLSALQLQELLSKNIYSINDISEDFPLTPHQKIVADCIKNNKTYVSPNLKGELQKIPQPFYYLDFESVTTAIPLYPDVPPHSQLLTQFSVHKCLEIDEVAEHFEYIADPKINNQKEIAQTLIACLGKEGAIITYSGSEKLSLLHLANAYEDLKESLLAIVERIIDFEYLIRNNYYNVEFGGHSSIKTILPVLVKDMGYDWLEINQGGDAAATFAFMALGIYTQEACEKAKEHLLRYCKQDTFAMVKIHKALLEIASAEMV